MNSIREIAQIKRITIAVKLAWVQTSSGAWKGYPLHQAFDLLQQGDFILESTKGPSSTFVRLEQPDPATSFFDDLPTAFSGVSVETTDPSYED